MQSNRISEELRLYYAGLREAAQEDALQRRATLLKAHPALAESEDQLSRAGFTRLRASMGSELEQAAAEARFKAVEAEHHALLAQLRLPEDYAPIDYHCKHCQDQGFLRGKSCPHCYPQALSAIWATQQEEDPLGDASFAHFDLNLFEDAEEFTRSPRRRMQALKTRMETYLENFGQRAERPNLLFSGITGTGKTYLAACMARALRDAGQSVMILSSPRLQRIFSEHRVLTNSYSPNAERLENSARQLDQINYCDFLVIDDLGTESLDAHSTGDFLALLNLRERSQKAILITTNLNLLQLRARYEERIYSRIAGTFQTYEFIGHDLRVKKRRS